MVRLKVAKKSVLQIAAYQQRTKNEQKKAFWTKALLRRANSKKGLKEMEKARGKRKEKIADILEERRTKEEALMATAHLQNYGEAGHKIDVEIHLAKKHTTKDQLRAKILNACWDYFGGIGIAQTIFDTIGFSYVESEVVEAFVRGKKSKELEALLETAQENISAKQQGVLDKWAQ